MTLRLQKNVPSSSSRLKTVRAKDCLTLEETKAVNSFETFETTVQPVIQHHIPHDLNPHTSH